MPTVNNLDAWTDRILKLVIGFGFMLWSFAISEGIERLAVIETKVLDIEKEVENLEIPPEWFLKEVNHVKTKQEENSARLVALEVLLQSLKEQLIKTNN